ncbi:hypothetical protein Tco_0768157 [Tanacetum coccineum]
MLDGGKAFTDAQLFTPIFEWIIPELLSVIRYYFPWNLTLPVFVSGFLARGGEPDNLDIPESSFLHPHALLASSILSVWLLLPRILFRRAYCKTTHGFLSEHNLRVDAVVVGLQQEVLQLPRQST